MSAASWIETVRFDEAAALVVRFARPARAASSAVLGGGLRDVSAVLHRSVRAQDEGALAAPEAWLRALAARLALDPETTVGLMTGVDLAHTVRVDDSAGGTPLVVLATAGLSNALRVGDTATVASLAPGTINLIVAIETPLVDAALVEALSIAVEARTLAVLETGIASTRSGLAATGTGTDAVVVAAPRGPAGVAYCGKHTELGEGLGRSVLRATGAAIAGARGRTA